MNKLKKLKPGQGGEIHVTDAIKQVIKNGESFYANIFQGKYLDCGTLSGYIDSGIQISKEKKSPIKPSKSKPEVKKTKKVSKK